MAGEIDQVSQAIGKLSEGLGTLKTVTDKTAETVDIIRSDQINARREIDYVKIKVTESAQMVDAMAPTVKDHHDLLLQLKPIIPLIPTLKEIDMVNKAGKNGVKVVGFLGSAGILIPLWLWLKGHIHFGP